ncbi:MAG: cobalt ECF transporter T component CbiQ, partial [Candidatus Methanoperedens sp.]|nr:cobalt ECF transporter T component CbiQ [Candidatus Methanoperedens sp.]
MHISLTDIERETYKKSVVHHIDGRIKILITLAIIVYAVALPRLDILNFMKLGALEVYIIIHLLLAKLDFSYLALRFAIALPFGFGIAAFQPFLKQPFISSITV